jgi:hypothetical protein
VYPCHIDMVIWRYSRDQVGNEAEHGCDGGVTFRQMDADRLEIDFWRILGHGFNIRASIQDTLLPESL